MQIDRPDAVERVARSFRVHPAVALVGPRQCGKSTLSRMVATSESSATLFFDLERAVDLRRLSVPEQALARLSGLVIIDEIQRQPALFETLRVLLDRPGQPGRFLLLGSASPALVRSASETLAGRVGIVDLSGFHLGEVGASGSQEPAPTNLVWRALWQRGGYPRSYLAPDDPASVLWRQSFVRTFLERVHTATGYFDSSRDPATLLDHGRPLPWRSLERFGVRTRDGDEPAGRSTLPGHPRRCPYGSRATALVREPEEATGQGSEDLRARHGASARTARGAFPCRPRRASEGRRVVRRIRDRATNRLHQSSQHLLLVHARTVRS